MEKRVIVSSVGHIIHELSRLYGYAVLVAGVDAFVLTSVTSLPLTRWNDGGVPRADVLVVSAVIGGWTALAVPLTVGFNMVTAEPHLLPGNPHYCERYAWTGGFLGNVIGHSFFQIVLVILPAALAGLNPKFYQLVGFSGREQGEKREGERGPTLYTHESAAHPVWS